MIEAQFATIRRRLGLPLVPGENAHLSQLKSELAEYFSGARRTFTVSLVYPGTPFEEEVWNALLRIPCGQTRSYQELARSLGRPGQRAPWAAPTE